MVAIETATEFRISISIAYCMNSFLDKHTSTSGQLELGRQIAVASVIEDGH